MIQMEESEDGGSTRAAERWIKWSRRASNRRPMHDTTQRGCVTLATKDEFASHAVSSMFDIDVRG
jgi:hypothetical protein